MKKILFLILSIALFSINIAYSYIVYSTETLSDGSIVKKCRFENGKIDYCTASDKQKAVNAGYNSLMKTASDNQNKISQYYPFYSEVKNKNNELINERDTLLKKKNIGVPIDENKLALLNFKIKVIEYVNIPPCKVNVFETGESTYKISGLGDIGQRYLPLIKAYETKQITKEEFSAGIAQFSESKSIIEKIYNEGINLSTLPKESPLEWVSQRYPNCSTSYFNKNGFCK